MHIVSFMQRHSHFTVLGENVSIISIYTISFSVVLSYLYCSQKDYTHCQFQHRSCFTFTVLSKIIMHTVSFLVNLIFTVLNKITMHTVSFIISLILPLQFPARSSCTP